MFEVYVLLSQQLRVGMKNEKGARERLIDGFLPPTSSSVYCIRFCASGFFCRNELSS
jgi:hypothetical protein